MNRCKICDFEVESAQSFGAHLRWEHKMKMEEYILQFTYQGDHPKCKVCGDVATWLAPKRDFSVNCKNKVCRKKLQGDLARELFSGKAQSERIKKLWRDTEYREVQEVNARSNQKKVSKAVSDGWLDPNSKYNSRETRKKMAESNKRTGQLSHVKAIRSQNMKAVNEGLGWEIYKRKSSKEVKVRSKNEVALCFLLDSLDLKWEYEPNVRGNNSYRPDFLVDFSGKKFLLELHIKGDEVKEARVKESGLKVIWIYLDKSSRKVLGRYRGCNNFSHEDLEGKDKWWLISKFFKKVKIKKVEQLENTETVYDLVEPEHKLFVTNGIFTYDTVNFGILYGKTPSGLAEDLGISLELAQEYIDAFFNGYPSLKKYFKSAEEEILTGGKVTTKFGREIPVEGWDSKKRNEVNRAVRSGSNATVQSAASDCVLWTINETYRDFQEKNLKSLMVASVHDSLEFDTYPGEFFSVLCSVKEQAEVKLGQKIDWIGCPITLGVEIGVSWGGASEFEIEFLSEDKFVGVGEGLKCDLEELEKEMSIAYDVNLEVLEEEEMKEKDIAYMINDKVLKVKLTVTKKT